MKMKCPVCGFEGELEVNWGLSWSEREKLSYWFKCNIHPFNFKNEQEGDSFHSSAPGEHDLFACPKCGVVKIVTVQQQQSELILAEGET